MNPYREQAEQIIYEAFEKLSIQDRTLFKQKYTIQQAGKVTVARKHLTYFMQDMFPYLSTAQQFQVILCEIEESLQNYKSKITNYNKKEFHVSEAQQLYSRYYQALYHYDKIPSIWLGESVGKADRLEIVQLICHLEIQNLKESLACFKQDLEAIEKEQKVSIRNMRYTLTLLGATLRFNGLASKHISLYTQDNFLNIGLPACTGKYQAELENYLLHHTSQKQLHAADSIVFAHDLRVALQHYQTSKSKHKAVEFEASLQGGAGTLHIGIFPFKFKFKKFDELSPVFIIFFVLTNFFNLFNGVHIFTSFIISIITASAISYLMVRNWQRRLLDRKIAAQLETEMNYIRQNITTEDAIQASVLYDDILERLRKHLLSHIDINDSARKPKKFADPLDVLIVYKKLLDKIQYISINRLSDYTLPVQKTLCLEVVKVALRQKLLKSLLQFIDVTKLLITHKIEATIYLDFLSLDVSTHSFWGNIWIGSRKNAYLRKLKSIQSILKTNLAYPVLYGEGTEALAAWISEQEAKINHNYFQKDIIQLQQNIDFYLDLEQEKIPFVLEMEEMTIYF